MGTNYYYRKNKEEVHIGKRSAAGLYCWDCKRTLCKGGNAQVHESCNHHGFCNCNWEDHCISCGQYPKKEGLESSSAGRELGFNTQKYNKKTGVQSCSSFTWAINPLELRNIRKIEDEYGRVFTKKQFYELLEECPIQYFHSIGIEFS